MDMPLCTDREAVKRMDPTDVAVLPLTPSPSPRVGERGEEDILTPRPQSGERGKRLRSVYKARGGGNHPALGIFSPSKELLGCVRVPHTKISRCGCSRRQPFLLGITLLAGREFFC